MRWENLLRARINKTRDEIWVKSPSSRRKSKKGGEGRIMLGEAKCFERGCLRPVTRTQTKRTDPGRQT